MWLTALCIGCLRPDPPLAPGTLNRTMRAAATHQLTQCCETELLSLLMNLVKLLTVDSWQQRWHAQKNLDCPGKNVFPVSLGVRLSTLCTHLWNLGFHSYLENLEWKYCPARNWFPVGDTFQASCYIVHHQGGHIHSRTLSQIAYAHPEKSETVSSLEFTTNFQFSRTREWGEGKSCCSCKRLCWLFSNFECFLLTG